MNPDVNPFQRSFVGEIRRIDEMARRARFFQGQIEKEKEKIPIRPLYDSVPLVTVGPRAAQTIDELDTKLAEHETRLIDMNNNYQVLSQRLKELVEARHVLRETAVFFDRVSLGRDAHSRMQSSCRCRLRARRARSGPRSTTALPLCYSTTTGRRSFPPVRSLISSA